MAGGQQVPLQEHTASRERPFSPVNPCVSAGRRLPTSVEAAPRVPLLRSQADPCAWAASPSSSRRRSGLRRARGTVAWRGVICSARGRAAQRGRLLRAVVCAGAVARAARAAGGDRRPVRQLCHSTGLSPREALRRGRLGEGLAWPRATQRFCTTSWNNRAPRLSRQNIPRKFVPYIPQRLAQGRTPWPSRERPPWRPRCAPAAAPRCAPPLLFLGGSAPPLARSWPPGARACTSTGSCREPALARRPTQGSRADCDPPLRRRPAARRCAAPPRRPRPLLLRPPPQSR